MKKISNCLGLIFSVMICISGTEKPWQEDECSYKGKKLYGKIQFVENASQADIKIKIVNNFPDIKVKFVESFADDCGEWQVVEHGGDLKVYVAENFADIKVKFVTSFPGMN